MEAQKILGISKQDFYSSKNIDFNPIKSDFDSVEIVGLGEDMHNVGTTFEAKAKLIKYMHENLGYDLIVFESGMFDCDKANQLMESGDTQNIVLFNGVFLLWWSEEVKELFSYIQQTQKSKDPITFAGMDIQSLRYSEKYFKGDLQKFVSYLNNLCNSQIKIDTPFLVSLKKAMRYSNTFAKLPTRDTLVLSHTFYKILNVIDSNAAENDTNMYVSFWKRNIIDQMEDYRSHYYKKQPIRDSMMAENIKWLKKRYPGKKMIIWAASIHLADNTSSIADKNYQGAGTGMYLKKQFDNHYYFLAFTTNFGRGGYKETGLFSFKFKHATPGSLEYYIDSTYSYDFAFLSLRDSSMISKFTLNNIDKAKIFGRKEIKMDIPKVCDGVFYIKEMHSPKYGINPD